MESINGGGGSKWWSDPNLLYVFLLEEKKKPNDFLWFQTHYEIIFSYFSTGKLLLGGCFQFKAKILKAYCKKNAHIFRDSSNTPSNWVRVRVWVLCHNLIIKIIHKSSQNIYTKNCNSLPWGILLISERNESLGYYCSRLGGKILGPRCCFEVSRGITSANSKSFQSPLRARNMF